MNSRAEETVSRAVRVTATGVDLLGDLEVPDAARGIVLFAHGSGSSRKSTRNRMVARELNAGHLATLLIDLLTPGEEDVDAHTRHLRFDIELLAERLGHAATWLTREPSTSHLAIGCFGASTGAAAALVCAARLPELIQAVVSRGGRPDLAGDALPSVVAPTLLIVGGEDRGVTGLNEIALEWLQCEKRLEIVPGATHLFEEPGTLDQVARLARDWFIEKLAVPESKREQ
jgi:pimeloyl-ACP methyl ester carboxylesterase